MPFVLPQKVDKTKTGFEMDFLKSNPEDPGSFVSVGTIEAKVEELRMVQKSLFKRLWRCEDPQKTGRSNCYANHAECN